MSVGLLCFSLTQSFWRYFHSNNSKKIYIFMPIFGPPAWASTSRRSSRLNSPDPSSSSSRNLGAQLGHSETRLSTLRHCFDIFSLSALFITFVYFCEVLPSSAELPVTEPFSLRQFKAQEGVEKSRIARAVWTAKLGLICQAGRKLVAKDMDEFVFHGQNSPQVSSSKQSMRHSGCSAN